MPPYENDMELEKRRAHVVWAAHILSYLTNQRPLVSLHHPPIADEEEEIEPDDLDAETESTVILTDSISSIRSKFLDCIAQLLSPSKGWDYVAAAAMREGINNTEIIVARNDCFLNIPSTSTRTNIAEFRQKMESYLSSGGHPDVHDNKTLPMAEFERIAIGYSSPRIEYWTRRFNDVLNSVMEPPDLDTKFWPGRQQAIHTWEELIELVSTTVFQEERELIVQRAYDCVSFTEVHSLLHAAFEPHIASKLWLSLKYLARTITDCRLLRQMSTRLAEFRNVRIFTVSSMPKTRIRPEFNIDLADAWSELTSLTPSPSDLAATARFNDWFKRDCAKEYSCHAEIQLFDYLQKDSLSALTVPYFGCSKKSCLLCEDFLHALSQPITTRGRHGICYSAWGVPSSKSVETSEALKDLEMNLVSRIRENFLKLQSRNKIRVTPHVAQSSIVTGLSGMTIQEMLHRERQVESVKQEETSLMEERRILEGHAVVTHQPDEPRADFEPHDSCVMCNKYPATLCQQCRSCYYCSKECQRSDWSSHKLLCKEFLTQSPRPSPSHRRAILFPVERTNPKLIWLPSTLEYSSDDEDYGSEPYELLEVDPLLGSDNPFVQTQYIEHNPIRDRNLGRGMVYWAPHKEGYAVCLKFRETFLVDGSVLNGSLLKSLGTKRALSHPWAGPIIAIRENVRELYEDITLGDFRHVLDHVVSYNSTEVRESDTSSQTHSPTVIRGVKICCYGETKLHGSDPFVLVDVPRSHPTRLTSSEGDISPISRLLGTPLRLWKFPDLERWLDPPGWEENLCADSNQNAAFLMMGMDPKKEGWGWAPLYWNLDLGNVLAVREDDRDLDLDFLRTMTYFTRKKIQPIIEDSIGSGLVPRTKQEVLDFITIGNMERCKEEMLEDNDH
ncbi:hypothetical protein F4677DRAFT_364396 [Hypoxylon crocopeplum]|nr:hypothetical protein F4677DRAFT_364396 [Hypoxylon crocopeplum]